MQRWLAKISSKHFQAKWLNCVRGNMLGILKRSPQRRVSLSALSLVSFLTLTLGWSGRSTPGAASCRTPPEEGQEQPSVESSSINSNRNSRDYVFHRDLKNGGRPTGWYLLGDVLLDGILSDVGIRRADHEGHGDLTGGVIL